MTEDETHDEIIALFDELPIYRKETLLKELRQTFDLDFDEDNDAGIEVEIIDDEYAA
ncbi:hypothetical protein [Phormidesmis priestleyi]|uniref:hypothetical protein n=1 Tax=Phormidesmis priestleyi TaxID=268141 RepID=UPI000AD1EBA3|nr:hypothetical protein [Phormidesmis priestleyi]